MFILLLSAFIFGYLPNSVPAQGTEIVKLAVYYESLCPDSDVFVHDQLAPAYEKVPDYLEVELIPYGNARWSGKPGSYKFSCQHGEEECYGNTVQACYTALINNTADQIQFVKCAFDIRRQSHAVERCIKDLDLRRQVKKCVTSTMGNNLLYQMGKKTDSLNPPHTFIPWITINGRGGQNLNDLANHNLMNVICEQLSVQPNQCKKSKWNILKKFRNYL
ncbi:gamma-interferon-inducible lysosomal thiol reductase [Parasteatoda tepidariorum]|uniref:gamma-interferon-inducible lysosomal thiol reductase n=1 Tax=Parasteatoda tepidariorum TaxID=114398 RepID=UPI00077FB6E7|nr:gamma-interferon-inducible lysosomal thiol reductase [Parasteatoda tepidariorum]